jgi:hypothetical protein
MATQGFVRKIAGVLNDHFIEPNADGSLNTIDRNYVWDGAAWVPQEEITGFATSAKQDTLLTELQKKADLAESQPIDTGTDLEFLLRALLAAIRDPVWLNIATNATQALLVSGSTTAVTGSLTTAGTVSTVTDITNIGANPANLMPINMSEISWGLTTRGLLI